MSRPVGEAARARLVAGTLFWLLILVAAYFVPRGQLANPDSHLALAYALVEQHTVRIDAYGQDLVDKAVYCGPRTAVRTCTHTYSDKAPGLSLLAALAYAPLRPLLPPALLPTGAGADRFLLRLLLTLLTVALPCAAFTATFWWFVRGFADGERALLVTVGYAFGSMALPFSTLLFSHALCAALLFWAFMLLFRAGEDPQASGGRVLLAGGLAGYAVGCEYLTAVIAILLGAYALRPRGPWAVTLARACRYAAGLALGLLPAAIYNTVAFGAPWTQGYAHLTDPLYARGMSQGLQGVGLPTWQALWGTSFSPYRGLFLLSPWLLLAVPGLLCMARAGRRREAWLCGAISLIYFLLQAGYAFWDGGASVGPRHFLPALPFLAFPVAFALDRATVRRIAVALIGLSVLAMGLILATNPLFADPRYVAHVGNPFVDQTLHDLATGRLQNNWGMVFPWPRPASLLPLALGVFLLGRRMRRGLAPGGPAALRPSPVAAAPR